MLAVTLAACSGGKRPRTCKDARACECLEAGSGDDCPPHDEIEPAEASVSADAAASEVEDAGLDASDSSVEAGPADAAQTMDVVAPPDAAVPSDAGPPEDVRPIKDAGRPSSVHARRLIEVPVDLSSFEIDPERRRIYAVGAYWDTKDANQLLTISADTGEILDRREVLGRAHGTALSDDGSTLWVALDGTHELLRVDVSGELPVLGIRHQAPRGKRDEILHARSLDVLPGTTDSLVLSLHTDNTPSLESVVIIDNGVPRAGRGPGHSGGAQVVATNDGKLYGADGYLYTFTFGPEGITKQTEHSEIGRGGHMTYDPDGFLYFDYGDIYDIRDPASVKHAGFFPWPGSTAPVPTSDLALQLGPFNADSGRLFMRKLDTSTYTELSTEELDMVLAPSRTVTDAKVIGEDTVAFLVFAPDTSHLFIFQDPQLLTVSSATKPEPSPVQRADLLELPLEIRSFVADPSRARIYAITPGRAEVLPNRLITLDGKTGAVLHTVPIGSEPGGLALSDDASTLWVGLAGSYDIRRVDLRGAWPTPGPHLQIPLALAQDSDPRYLAVLRGTTDVVGVASPRLDSLTSQGFTLFESGIAQTNRDIDWHVSNLVTGPANVLFGVSEIYGSLATLTLSPSPPYFVAFNRMATSSNSKEFVFDQRNTLYFYSGAVLDVTTPAMPQARGNLGAQGPVAAIGAETVVMLTCTEGVLTLRKFNGRTLAALGTRMLDRGVNRGCQGETNLALVAPGQLAFAAGLPFPRIYMLPNLASFLAE